MPAESIHQELSRVRGFNVSEAQPHRADAATPLLCKVFAPTIARMDDKPDKPDKKELDEGWFAVTLLAVVFAVIGGLYLFGLITVGWGVK
jgi:hypothetical protein